LTLEPCRSCTWPPRWSINASISEKANDAVVGVRKIASRILRYRVFIEKCYQIKIALFLDIHSGFYIAEL